MPTADITKWLPALDHLPSFFDSNMAAQIWHVQRDTALNRLRMLEIGGAIRGRRMGVAFIFEKAAKSA